MAVARPDNARLAALEPGVSLARRWAMTDRRDNAPPPDGWAIPSRELTYPKDFEPDLDIPNNIVQGMGTE
jgi:hypothetical protein